MPTSTGRPRRPAIIPSFQPIQQPAAQTNAITINVGIGELSSISWVSLAAVTGSNAIAATPAAVLAVPSSAEHAVMVRMGLSRLLLRLPVSFSG